MKIIQANSTAFLLALCIFSVVTNKRVYPNGNLASVSDSVQSGKKAVFPCLQSMGEFAIKIKDTVNANRYISASILTGVLIGSYFYFKRFFRNTVKVTPSVKQSVVSQELLADSAKEIAPEQIISQTEAMSPTEGVNQEQVTSPEEAVNPESASPITRPMVDDNQDVQVIKIMNNQDQPLNICVSSSDDNDAVKHRFTVSNQSFGVIRVK